MKGRPTFFVERKEGENLDLAISIGSNGYLVGRKCTGLKI